MQLCMNIMYNDVEKFPSNVVQFHLDIWFSSVTLKEDMLYVV